MSRRPSSKRFIALFGVTIMVALFACTSVLRAAETPVDFRFVRGAVMYSPMPELARAWLTNSSCTVHMVVDHTTGLVTNVYVAESSGDAYLNFKIVDALRHWKFRPGTPRLIRVTFGTSRVWPYRHY